MGVSWSGRGRVVGVELSRPPPPPLTRLPPHTLCSSPLEVAEEGTEAVDLTDDPEYGPGFYRTAAGMLLHHEEDGELRPVDEFSYEEDENGRAMRAQERQG